MSGLDRVDGDGEADVLGAGDDGGVDADDLAAGVDQRPAGVAGVDGGVGLDEVVERMTPSLIARSLAETMPAGDAGVAAQVEGVADGDHVVADPQVGAGAELGRREVGAVDAWMQGDVVGGEAPTSSAVRAGAVEEAHRDLVPAPSITWALVRMSPSAAMTTPEPAPPNRPSGLPVWMVTTDGLGDVEDLLDVEASVARAAGPGGGGGRGGAVRRRGRPGRRRANAAPTSARRRGRATKAKSAALRGWPGGGGRRGRAEPGRGPAGGRGAGGARRAGVVGDRVRGRRARR